MQHVPGITGSLQAFPAIWTSYGMKQQSRMCAPCSQPFSQEKEKEDSWVINTLLLFHKHDLRMKLDLSLKHKETVEVEERQIILKVTEVQKN